MQLLLERGGPEVCSVEIYQNVRSKECAKYFKPWLVELLQIRLT